MSSFFVFALSLNISSEVSPQIFFVKFCTLYSGRLITSLPQRLCWDDSCSISTSQGSKRQFFAANVNTACTVLSIAAIRRVSHPVVKTINKYLFVSNAVYDRIDAAVDEDQDDGENVETSVDVGHGKTHVEQEVADLVRCPADNVGRRHRGQGLDHVHPGPRPGLLLGN